MARCGSTGCCGRSSSGGGIAWLPGRRRRGDGTMKESSLPDDARARAIAAAIASSHPRGRGPAASGDEGRLTVPVAMPGVPFLEFKKKFLFGFDFLTRSWCDVAVLQVSPDRIAVYFFVPVYLPGQHAQPLGLWPGFAGGPGIPTSFPGRQIGTQAAKIPYDLKLAHPYFAASFVDEVSYVHVTFSPSDQATVWPVWHTFPSFEAAEWFPKQASSGAFVYVDTKTMGVFEETVPKSSFDMPPFNYEPEPGVVVVSNPLLVNMRTSSHPADFAWSDSLKVAAWKYPHKLGLGLDPDAPTPWRLDVEVLTDSPATIASVKDTYLTVPPGASLVVPIGQPPPFHQLPKPARIYLGGFGREPAIVATVQSLIDQKFWVKRLGTPLDRGDVVRVVPTTGGLVGEPPFGPVAWRCGNTRVRVMVNAVYAKTTSDTDGWG